MAIARQVLRCGYYPTLRKKRPPALAEILELDETVFSDHDSASATTFSGVIAPNSNHGFLRKRHRLLLLEDDLDLCAILDSLLTSHGCEVTTVNRAVDGIRKVMTVDFDAVVCDIMMPGMRGDMFYTAVDRIKPWLCRGFVFITAHRDDSETSVFLRTVGCDVVYKPLDTNDLLTKVTQAIQRVRLKPSAVAA